MSRRLLVTVRNTPSGSTAEYASRWTRLQQAVHDAGGRAWRFHGLSGATRHLEFVEWKHSDGDLPIADDPRIHGRLEALDAIGTIESRHVWEESTP